MDYWEAEGVIISKSSNESIYSSSIDLNKLDELSLNVEDGINVASTTVYINDEEADTPTDLVFIGYDLNSDRITAPVIEGRVINSENEIMISSNIKDDLDININSKLGELSLSKEIMFAALKVAYSASITITPKIKGMIHCAFGQKL